MNEPELWPIRTEQDQRERIIGEVYGNIHMEYPDITRKQVAEIYDRRREGILKIPSKQY